MGFSSALAPRSAPTLRIAGGRVALVHDGSRIVLAAATEQGMTTGIALFAPMARSWAARVAPVLEPLPQAADVTPVELRTPWLRGDDGEPAIALERVARGPLAEWRLLVGRALAIALAERDVRALHGYLLAPPEAALEVG